MILQPIDAEDLPAFIEAAEREYAEQKSAMGGVEPEEARRQAAEEMAAMFPDGNLQPGHVVLRAVGDDGLSQGRVWVAPQPGRAQVLFVYNVRIEPELRGRGLGRELMELTHAWAREHGFSDIALHVFGGNDAAIQLYRSLDYQTTDIHMRRPL